MDDIDITVSTTAVIRQYCQGIIRRVFTQAEGIVLSRGCIIYIGYGDGNSGRIRAAVSI